MGETQKIPDIKNTREFEKLFREFFTPLTHYAYKIVRDLDSSKEIVHKVFINLWERKEAIHSNTSFKSYLFTAVHNRCLNHIRDNAKFTGLESMGTSIDVVKEVPEVEDFDDSVVMIRIEREINNLPERCAEIFKLARFENKKYREIADELGLSLKTVEAQMSKALKILREKLVDLRLMILLVIILIFASFG